MKIKLPGEEGARRIATVSLNYIFITQLLIYYSDHRVCKAKQIEKQSVHSFVKNWITDFW
jgi:hypothetical protein